MRDFISANASADKRTSSLSSDDFAGFAQESQRLLRGGIRDQILPRRRIEGPRGERGADLSHRLPANAAGNDGR